MSFPVTSPAPICCKACECVQEPAVTCRRCGKAFPGILLPVEVVQPKLSPSAPKIIAAKLLPKTLREAKREAIRAALDYTDGDIMRAAKLLGTGKTSLYTWRRKFPNWFQNGALDAK